MNRDLDGCYFRVRRDGEWDNVCFSDLSAEERAFLFDKTKEKSASYWKSLAYHLADCLQAIGNQFNIYCERGSYDTYLSEKAVR